MKNTFNLLSYVCNKYTDEPEPYEKPQRIKVNHCPHCGGTVRLELSVNFLVCNDCDEMLYAEELI